MSETADETIGSDDEMSSDDVLEYRKRLEGIVVAHSLEDSVALVGLATRNTLNILINASQKNDAEYIQGSIFDFLLAVCRPDGNPGAARGLSNILHQASAFLEKEAEALEAVKTSTPEDV